MIIATIVLSSVSLAQNSSIIGTVDEEATKMLMEKIASKTPKSDSASTIMVNAPGEYPFSFRTLGDEIDFDFVVDGTGDFNAQAVWKGTSSNIAMHLMPINRPEVFIALTPTPGLSPLSLEYRFTEGDLKGTKSYRLVLYNNAKGTANGTISIEYPKNEEGSATPQKETIVHVAGRQIPLTTYENYVGNSLWIEDSIGWVQYMEVPQFASLSLVAYVPKGGQGLIYEMHPSEDIRGNYSANIYDFTPGYSRLIFRSDAIGRHVLSFVVNDQPSNDIVIDVQKGLILGGS